MPVFLVESIHRIHKWRTRGKELVLRTGTGTELSRNAKAFYRKTPRFHASVPVLFRASAIYDYVKCPLLARVLKRLNPR